MGSHTSRITRSGDLTAAVTLNWAISAGTGTNPVNAADFPGGVFPSGTATVPANATYVDVTFTSNPDTAVETDETGLFTVTSSQPGVTVAASPQAFTITNDDTASGGIVYGPTTTLATPVIDTTNDVYSISFDADADEPRLRYLVVDIDPNGSGLALRLVGGANGWSIDLVTLSSSNQVLQEHSGTVFDHTFVPGERLEAKVDANKWIVPQAGGVPMRPAGPYKGYIDFGGAPVYQKARAYAPVKAMINVTVKAGA